jgi:uncharacterized protein (TIGR01244 family)
MDTLRTITPTIAVAGQPTEADLKSLKSEGYAAVVNLRNDGEPEQPISTAAEGDLARATGLDYLHYGVGGAPFSSVGIDSVNTLLDQHKGEKVLVHCRSGGRASAVVLLHLAQEHGWSASEAIAKGRALGLEVKGGLQLMVEQYLASHPTR